MRKAGILTPIWLGPAKAVPILFPRKLRSRKVEGLRACTVLKLCKKWVQMFSFVDGSAFAECHQFQFLPFAQRAFQDVRRFVEACDTARRETADLFEIARKGGDLSPFVTSHVILDRADMAGDTPLHWAVRRGDLDQIKKLMNQPESYNRMKCRCNHKGEIPNYRK